MMGDILGKLKELKPVTNPLIFPMEINYICSKGDEVHSQIESQMSAANKTIDDYKTDGEKQGLLDVAHIALQAFLSKS